MSSLTPSEIDPYAVPGVQLALVWDDVANPPTVSRLDPDGVYRLVRGGNPVTLDGSGHWTGYDYEPPFDVPVLYAASNGDSDDPATPDAVTITSLSITLPSHGQAWLKHVLHPELSAPVMLTRLPDITRAARVGTFPVLGRSEPVAVSSPRVAPTGSLDFRTDDDDERAAIVDLLADGTVLVLITPGDTGFGSLYVMPGDLDEKRVTHLGSQTVRLWTLAFTAVDRPR